MAGINIGVGGAWKNVANLSVGVGGAWKQVVRVSIGVAGAWKAAWVALNCEPASAADSELNPADAYATLNFNNDGTVTGAGNGGSSSFTWLPAGSAADYDIRVTVTGDTGSMTGSALSTWLNLGTNRSWTLEDLSSVGAGNAVTGTYEIGLTGTATAIASNTFDLQAEVYL